MTINRSLRALTNALRDAKAIGARVHIARHDRDWPDGQIVGRTKSRDLIYETEDGALAVLFADWLKVA